ncbi:MAG: MerR family transcriptional regulator [Lachnospiraceae bacterium]
MNQNYMTISELAKLRKTTTATLRYYDQIGLLKPDYVSPETGYRYYTIFQYEKLGTILELRSLGMPIDQILEYFHERNFNQSIDILREYQQRLEKKIKEQEETNRILKEKLEYAESLKDLGPMETVFLETYEERNMITFGQPSGTPENHAYAYTKLEWYLNEMAPILATDRVGVFADEAILRGDEQSIPAIPMILVDQKESKGKYTQTIPEGEYACMYYQNGRLEQYHPSFEKMKQYIKENGYEIAGNILQIYKIDVTLTSDRAETVIELQVPVRKYVKK